jgi:hypothetical protein
MTEFVFRNLSVKVFPVRSNEFCSDKSLTVVECTPCTELCTGTVLPDCEPCTQPPESIAITVGPYCNGPGTSPGYVDTTTRLILPADDMVAQLATLKASLRLAMSAVEAAEAKVNSPEGLDIVAGVDRVRSELMDAVAELDEYREQLG